METGTTKRIDAALAELHRQSSAARSQIAHADTKASLLAAGAIPIAALLLATPALTDSNRTVAVVAWGSAGFIIGSVGLLGSVVWPRLSGRIGIKAAANRPVDEVLDTVRVFSEQPERQLAAAAEEWQYLATLAFRKFRRLQGAIVCLAVAVVLVFIAAFVIGQTP